jgi:SAM-dependent methyltransferase
MPNAFPRTSKYHPDWILSSVSGGANSLELTEWLGEAMDLRPGMRVLDLGCGRGASSIFLHREFGVQVWSTDLWFSPTERLQRIRDAGAADGVFPLHSDARALPFADGFFDAAVSIDSLTCYYGCDPLFLNLLARFVKPGGQIGVAGAGLLQEIEGPLPEHLRAWWTPDCWAFHSPAWWHQHWERTGLVDVTLSDAMPEGWQRWLAWHRLIAPDNHLEIAAVEADAGATLGYVRMVARRTGAEAQLPALSVPVEYKPAPLARLRQADQIGE